VTSSGASSTAASTAYLADRVVEDSQHVALFDLVAIGGAVAHGASDLEGVDVLDGGHHARAVHVEC
jgi:hypothetical protein